MPRLLALLSTFLFLFGSACTFSSVQYFVSEESYELARIDRADGSKDVFELRTKPGGDAALRLVSEFTRKRAFLGLQVAELDRAGAERRGVTPYQGLLVQGTYPRSAAEAAGIVAGDVLLSLGDKPTVYLNHVGELERTLTPGQKVTAVVLRGQVRTEIEVTAHELVERVTEPQDIELDKPPASHPYAGVVLRGIPGIWCERMFGADKPAVIIASVDYGSPAWEAGFRGGDLIEAVDGGDVPPMVDLARTIRERGAAGQPIHLRVRRGQDRHAADIALTDYTETSQVWFPLLFRIRDGVQTDRWSVGPFGLLMSNRNSWVADNTTREPKTENVFSALLGLIHVRSGPRDDSVRLLWFIHID